MPRMLIVAALVFTSIGAAGAQEQRRTMPLPGTICPDGSDPGTTGVGCVMPAFRNAIDEGRTSSTPTTPNIIVPNDPLGNAAGTGDPGIGGYNGYGNRGINLPKIR